MTDSDFSFEDSIGALSGRLSKALSVQITRKFRKNGLTLSIDQMIVLIHLWREDGQNQHQLGERAGHHKTMVTRAITNLEEQNMVVRIPDPQDGRIRRVFLTHLGRTVREQLIPHVKEVQAAALEGISAKELSICKSVVRKIISNLHQTGSCSRE